MGKKQFKQKTKELLQHKLNYNFSRDAEWYKRTQEKLLKVKEDLNKNFYNEERKKQKTDFISRLKGKLKDYTDAIKFQSRYKKIRFVERRKLERKFTKINKEIKEEKDNDALKTKEELKNEIVRDLNYVKYYPMTYKYYSLFPLNDKDKKEMVEKREKMRKKIEFFVNRKHNKEKEYFEEDNNEIPINEQADKIIEEKEELNNEITCNDDEINKMEIENDSIPNMKEEGGDNSKHEKQTKVKMNKNKEQKSSLDTKTKTKLIEANDNDYESIKHKKKKPFKDDFFILDED